jgi:hypothetical protein
MTVPPPLPPRIYFQLFVSETNIKVSLSSHTAHRENGERRRAETFHSASQQKFEWYLLQFGASAVCGRDSCGGRKRLSLFAFSKRRSS